MRRVQISCDICTRFPRYLYSTKKSWIIKCRLRKSFLQESISGVLSVTQANISRLGLWLVQVECGMRGLPHAINDRSHYFRISQYLANRHLYRPELRIDVGSTSKWHIFSGIINDCQKLSKLKRVYCTCIETVYTVILLLCFHDPKFQLSVRIWNEQHQSRFGFHNHSVISLLYGKGLR